jgi:[acyl-carrier-protein] S-malonyltransferase
MKKLAFIFPGQGSQKIGMGKEFYNNFNEAKEAFQEIDETLQQNLSQLIFSGQPEELTKTQNTQPALMAVSVAIMQVILKQNKTNISQLAGYVAGHSLGEYSALCAGEAINIADTAKILQIRGNAMAQAGEKTKGAMAAIIGTDIETANKIAKIAAQKQVCQVANDNSIGQIVISGNVEAIKRALDIGKEHGAKKVILLPVSGAFHSPLVEEAAHQVQEGLTQIIIKAPQIPVITNVTAQAEQDPTTIANLLVQQITEKVRWREIILELENLGVTDIIEVGSGNVLTSLTKRISKNIKSSNISTLDDLDNFSKNYC